MRCCGFATIRCSGRAGTRGRRCDGACLVRQIKQYAAVDFRGGQCLRGCGRCDRKIQECASLNLCWRGYTCCGRRCVGEALTRAAAETGTGGVRDDRAKRTGARALCTDGASRAAAIIDGHGSGRRSRCSRGSGCLRAHQCWYTNDQTDHRPSPHRMSPYLMIRDWLLRGWRVGVLRRFEARAGVGGT